jgi:hypothetical protein
VAEARNNINDDSLSRTRGSHARIDRSDTYSRSPRGRDFCDTSGAIHGIKIVVNMPHL